MEQAFASDINATMRSELRSESNQKKRQRRRELLKAKKRASDPFAAQAAEATSDFRQATQSKSLHDVAQAPPTITAIPKERLKRKASSTTPTPLAALDAQAAARPKPSAARQRILDEERQRVIQQYRAMKHRTS